MNDIVINGETYYLLFMFNNNSKDYAVYRDKDNNISASIVKSNGTEDYEFLAIETDEEWDMVDKRIAEKFEGINHE